MTAAKGGLEGVVATSSSICHIDGEQGLLSYCGYDIHDLAQEATFEEVCHLLWHRRLPSRAELGDLRSELAAARRLPEAVLRLMRTLPPGDAMDALRTLVSALALIDPKADARTGAAVQDPDASYHTAVRLTAQVGSLVATWGRLAAAGGPIDPDPALDHAANVLLMLNGERPTREAARALDVALILHADHELNASTFAARVTGATLSDLYSTAVAGIGALKGPLHGGANAEVMRMLLDLGEAAPDDVVERTIRGMLAKKQKVPGFGHRVYRTEDPRATHLRRMSETLSKQTETRWFAMSPDHRAGSEGSAADRRQRRFLFRLDVPHAGHSHRALHADLCGKPNRRLDGPRPGAVREQPPDPSPCRIHWSEAAPAVPAARPARIIREAVRPALHEPPPDPQFLHHCAHRSWEIDAGGSLP